MKFCCKYIEEYLDYNKENTYTITIENKNLFREILKELNRQTKENYGDFIITENDKELNFSKSVFLIFDYMNLETDANIQKQIIKGLSNLVSDTNMSEEIINQQMIFNTTIEKLLLEYEFELETEVLNICDIIKLLKPKIKKTDIFSIDVFNFIKFLSNHLKYKLIVFVSLKTYLDKNELMELLYQLEIEKIQTLLIESKLDYKLENENIILIDKDLCQIDEISN